jgi:tetratricopeptide (TPR) repeat protein
VLLHRGALEAAEQRFRELEELGRAAERGDWLARGLEHRGRVAWLRGHLDEARTLFEQGLERVPAAERRIAADLHNGLGNVFYYRGDPDAAFSHHELALRLRQRLRDRPGIAKSLSNIGNLLLTFRDDPEGARDHYKRALGHARAVGDRQLIVLTLNNLGGVANERGEWKTALKLFEEAVRIQEETGWSFAGYVALQNRVVAETALGLLGPALAHARACLEKGDAVLEPMNRVNTRLCLFDIYLKASMDDAAEQVLAETEKLARDQNVDEQQEEILMRRGRLLAARGAWRDAAAAFAAAGDAARRLNHPPVEKLALAHRRRAEARAGTPTLDPQPIELPEGSPLFALVTYLEADRSSVNDPSPEAAASLGRAGELAARLGEVSLERAAFEREAELARALGDGEREAAAMSRAARAFERLRRGLPEEIGTAFASHPRNARLGSMRTKRASVPTGRDAGGRQGAKGKAVG